MKYVLVILLLLVSFVMTLDYETIEAEAAEAIGESCTTDSECEGIDPY